MNRTWKRRLMAWLLLCVVVLYQTGYGSMTAMAEGTTGGTTPATYTVSVSGGSGTFFYKSGDTYIEIQDSAELAPGTYEFSYVGGEQRLIQVDARMGEQAVTGTIECESVSANAVWTLRWMATVTLQENLTLTASEDSLALCVEEAVSVMPGMTYTVALCAASGGSYATDCVPAYTIRRAEAMPEDVQIVMDGHNRAKLVYHATGEPVVQTLSVEAVPASVEQAEVAYRTEISVLCSALVYGRDYVCASDVEMFAAQRDGRQTIFHNGRMKSIKLIKGSYTAFRYRDGNTGYPVDFTDFGPMETVRTIALGADAFYLQMKNTTAGSEAFGATGEVCVVADQQAPTLAAYKNGTVQQTDPFHPVLLGVQDKLTLRASEGDAESGIARIVRVDMRTGDEETIQQAGGLQHQLETSGISCAEGYHLMKYRVYDHVGNVSELSFVVSYDAQMPAVAVRRQEASVYEGDASYYVNRTGIAAVSVIFEDEHLDMDSIDVTGPARQLRVTERGQTKYCAEYEITGTGTVTFSAKDTHGNVTRKNVSVVLDTSAPQVHADSVRLRDADSSRTNTVQTPYATTYDAEAFHEPLLSFSITEAHLLRTEIEIGDGVLTLQPNTPQGDTYTYTDISLEEFAAFEKEQILLRVYDKAGNCHVYTYENAYNNQVTYVKTETTLLSARVSNAVKGLKSKQFIVPDQGTIHIEVTAQAELFIPALMEVTLRQTDAQGHAGRVVATYHDGAANPLKVTRQANTWKITCDYTLKAEDTDGYVIEVAYRDIATNQIHRLYSDIYDIDQKPVALSVSSSPVSENGRTDQPVQVVYTMHEANPDFDRFVYTYSSMLHDNSGNLVAVSLVKPDGTKEQVSIAELTTRICDESVWRAEGSVYTLTLEYSQQSMYDTSLTVYDIMDTRATADCKFRIDTEAPELVSVDVKTTYVNKNQLLYDRFDAEKAVVTVKLTDKVAAPEEITVTCVAKDQETGGNRQVQGVLSQSKDESYVYLMTIEKNFKGTLSFVLTDGYHTSQVESVSYIKGIVLEDATMHKQTSKLEILTMNAANQNGFYRSDVQLKFTAQDTYSGIRKMTYTLNGQKYSDSFDKETQQKTTWEKTGVKLAATKQNEGNEIPVTLELEDCAGHQDTITKTLKLDVSKPQISVAFDHDRVRNQKYYQEDRTATITIRELNYDATATSVVVYKDGTPIQVTPHFRSDGKIKQDAAGAAYKEYQMALVFSEDGVYTFEVSTVDLAGNTGKFSYRQEFVIDHTAPQITLAFNNVQAAQGQYYGETRVATVTVDEHNFRASDFQIVVTATKDGEPVAAPEATEFTSSADVHTASVAFTQDGEYTISVQGMDLAGNEAARIEAEPFVIDVTAPEITITGVQEQVSYNREVLPVVTVQDGNYDPEGVEITITGGKHGVRTELTPQLSSSGHTHTYTYQDLRYLRAYDDSYTIAVTVTDRAGHTTQESMHYRVNRFGSTYTYSDALQEMLDVHYGKSSVAYTIVETNVDALTEYHLTYTLDGEIVAMEEGEDYTVSVTRTKQDWYQYEYNLAQDTFAKEGTYAVTVSSTDAAGNITDNNARNAQIGFCIDNTAPSCIISGVRDGQKFDEEERIDIGIEVYDNTQVQSICVRLNGEQIASEAEFTEGRFRQIAIDRSIRQQTLEIISRDAAGNERREAVAFVCNQRIEPVAVATGAGIALAGLAGIGGIAMVIFRRRRR